MDDTTDELTDNSDNNQNESKLLHYNEFNDGIFAPLFLWPIYERAIHSLNSFKNCFFAV